MKRRVNDALVSLGCTNVLEVEGRTGAWEAAGYEVVRHQAKWPIQEPLKWRLCFWTPGYILEMIYPLEIKLRPDKPAGGYRRVGKRDFCHRQTTALMIQ